MFAYPYKHTFYVCFHGPYMLFFFPPDPSDTVSAYYLSTQVILVAQLNSTWCYHPKTIPANNQCIPAKNQTNQPNTSGSWRFLGKSLVPKRPLRPLFPFLHICTTEERNRALPTLDCKQHALSPQMLFEENLRRNWGERQHSSEDLGWWQRLVRQFSCGPNSQPTV